MSATSIGLCAFCGARLGPDGSRTCSCGPRPSPRPAATRACIAVLEQLRSRHRRWFMRVHREVQSGRDLASAVVAADLAIALEDTTLVASGGAA